MSVARASSLADLRQFQNLDPVPTPVPSEVVHRRQQLDRLGPQSTRPRAAHSSTIADRPIVATPWNTSVGTVTATSARRSRGVFVQPEADVARLVVGVVEERQPCRDGAIRRCRARRADAGDCRRSRARARGARVDRRGRARSAAAACTATNAPRLDPTSAIGPGRFVDRRGRLVEHARDRQRLERRLVEVRARRIRRRRARARARIAAPWTSRGDEANPCR